AEPELVPARAHRAPPRRSDLAGRLLRLPGRIPRRGLGQLEHPHRLRLLRGGADHVHTLAVAAAIHKAQVIPKPGASPVDNLLYSSERGEYARVSYAACG